MAKEKFIQMTEQEREDFGKIIAVCRYLANLKENDISNDEAAIGAMLVRSLLGDDQQSSLLYRAGFTKMFFLDTARTMDGMTDIVMGDNVSNYNVTGSIKLPLLIKHIENDQPILLAPLFTDEKRIRQSVSIGFNQWYLQNRVYVCSGMELNRQKVLQLFVSISQGDEKLTVVNSNLIVNSGIYHNEVQVPFADSPLNAMAKEILFEVKKSLEIEGILYIKDVKELARRVLKHNDLFIRSLSIRNYKLYGDAPTEYTFNDRFTVLIGDNAQGKTTILDSIRILLDTILPSHADNPKRKIVSGLKEIFPITTAHRELDGRKIHYRFPIEISADTYYRELKRSRQKDSKRATKKIKIDLRDELDRLPLIAYCGVERTRPLEKREIDVKKSNTRYDGYLYSLNARASISFIKIWLRELQQEAKRSKKAAETHKCFVDVVCGCLQQERIVNIQYMYQGFSRADGKQQGIVDDLILYQREMNDDNHTYTDIPMFFSSLSAGYKVMVGLIADLAYRCIILNPQLEKDAITGTSGIVLIDEIDMHLHPLWQRHIVEDLMRCFPKVQFIATTHSPFIVQSLKKEQVISLAGKEIECNPTEANIDASIRYMGIDNMYGKDFNNQVTLAKKFFTILRQKDVNENELRRIHAEYVSRYGDDAVLLARLNLAETIAYERHKG